MELELCTYPFSKALEQIFRSTVVWSYKIPQFYVSFHDSQKQGLHQNLAEEISCRYQQKEKKGHNKNMKNVSIQPHP